MHEIIQSRIISLQKINFYSCFLQDIRARCKDSVNVNISREC